MGLVQRSIFGEYLRLPELDTSPALPGHRPALWRVSCFWGLDSSASSGATCPNRPENRVLLPLGQAGREVPPPQAGEEAELAVAGGRVGVTKANRDVSPITARSLATRRDCWSARGHADENRAEAGDASARLIWPRPSAHVIDRLWRPRRKHEQTNDEKNWPSRPSWLAEVAGALGFRAPSHFARSPPHPQPRGDTDAEVLALVEAAPVRPVEHLNSCGSVAECEVC